MAADLAGGAVAADEPAPRGAARWAPGAILLPTDRPNNVYVFGGQFTTQLMSLSYLPMAVEHEDNYIVGGSFGRDLVTVPGWMTFGVEVGIAERFGLGTSSTEVWGGGKFRYNGPQLFKSVHITPALTVGMSAVTGTAGVEALREATRRGNAHFLGYLGPEIALSLPSRPEWELVYRLHHRSGAGATFGGMFDAANANVLGIRYRF